MKHNKTILCTIIGLFFYTPIFTKSDQPVDETKHLLVIHPDILERQAAQELESIPEPEIQAKPISTTGQAVLDLCSEIAGQVTTIVSNRKDPVAKAEGIKGLIQMIIAGIANIIQKRREAKRLKKLNQTKRSPYYFDDEEDDFNVQDIMKQALQALQEHNDFMLEQEN
ncbi:hypothetical protein EBQ93_00560 [bacterium]|nr:hypothetical protein [bacterium]